MQHRRWFLALVTFGLASAAASTQAQDFPTRPIKLIVPYAAGGPTDTFARALAETWGKKLGVSMIVENRTGPSSQRGTKHKTEPEGRADKPHRARALPGGRNIRQIRLRRTDVRPGNPRHGARHK